MDDWIESHEVTGRSHMYCLSRDKCSDCVESHVSDCVPFHCSQPQSHTYCLNDYSVVLSVVMSFVNGNYSSNVRRTYVDYMESLTTGFFHYRQFFGTRSLTVASVIIFGDNRANLTFLLCIVTNFCLRLSVD